MLGKEKPGVKIIDNSIDESYAKFVIEPLERGFGHTLGNSLRRVLLSMLPGVAATLVKINGITHEFSTIEGVREDVTEIILNIKDLVAKLEGCESKTVSIDVMGPTQITAEMIAVDSEISFLNPNLIIANLEENIRFRAEITFSSGLGYVSAEQNRILLSGANIGSIPVDSVFTPVVKVNNLVANTRIGHITDYDKLTLEIWTNGVLSAKEALSLASAELMEHFEIFLKLSEKTGVPNSVSKIITEVNLDHKNVTIDDLDLSVRANNSLKRAGLQTLYDLTIMTKDEISKIRNLGKKSFDEVIEKLVEFGYRFDDDGLRPPIFHKPETVQASSNS